MSIPPGLSQRLHKTLLRCAPFDSDQALAAVFVDDRISQWAADLPEATSKGERARAVIKYLADKRNTAGENALVLFLYALADNTVPNDSLHNHSHNSHRRPYSSCPLPILDRNLAYMENVYETLSR